MRATLLFVLSLLLAGCLEAQAPPESSVNATSPTRTTPATTMPGVDAGAGPDDARFAFRLWTPCATCWNVSGMPATLDLFFASGRALRAELVAGDADAFRESKDGPSSALVMQTLAEAGARDLVPTRVSTVELPDAVVARVRIAVAQWAPPEAFLDQPCEMQCPTVFGRAAANGSAATWETLEVTRTPDLDDARNAGVRGLYVAFFEAARILEGGAPPPTAPASAGPSTSNLSVPERPPPPSYSGGVDWQGQDSEFGSIRAPFRAELVNGTRTSVEARVVLREHYEGKDTRFFMFRWSVENTPLEVRFDHLVRTDTGEEIPCYQREGDAWTHVSCFVDLKDMPPVGTEIRMIANVGASRAGTFQVGAIVIPFTYAWMRVPMSNGLDAELYAGTQLVHGEGS